MKSQLAPLKEEYHVPLAVLPALHQGCSLSDDLSTHVQHGDNYFLQVCYSAMHFLYSFISSLFLFLKILMTNDWVLSWSDF